MNKRFFAGVILVFATQVWAEQEPIAAPEPPVLPAQLASGEALEPEVTIIERGKETLHEYRLNGQLYMVKIVPEAGAPYYLIDSDGDGTLDVYEVGPKNVAVPQWVLFSW